jgi:hypothetical protein
MKRKDFFRTLGGLAALIPALKAKAASVESEPEVRLMSQSPVSSLKIHESPEYRIPTFEDHPKYPETNFVAFDAESISVATEFIEVSTLENQYRRSLDRIPQGHTVTLKGINDYQKLSGNLGTPNRVFRVTVPGGEVRINGMLTDYWDDGATGYIALIEADRIAYKR